MGIIGRTESSVFERLVPWWQLSGTIFQYENIKRSKALSQRKIRYHAALRHQTRP